MIREKIKGGVVEINVEDLEPHPFHYQLYNYQYTQNKLLSDSIERYGILQPLVVVPHTEKEGKYRILLGVRRWMMAKNKKMKKVPAIIIHNLTEEEEEMMILHGNITRKESWREKYNVYLALTQCLNMKKKVAREYVSKLFETSEGTMAKVIYVFQREDKYPELVYAVDRGTISLNEAYKMIQEYENNSRNNTIEINTEKNGILGNLLEAVGTSVLNELGLPALRRYIEENVEIDNMIMVYGKKNTRDELIRIMVEYKNHKNPVSNKDIEKMIGAIALLPKKPHIKIIVASRLTEIARQKANENGIFVISLGRQVTIENINVIKEKLKREFTKILCLL